MRFRLIFLILFYSQIFAQTTFYVKYTTLENTSIAFSEANIILKTATQSLSKEKQKLYQVTSLKSQFGKLNQNLDRIIKYDVYSSEALEIFNNTIKNNSSIEFIHTSSNYYIDENPNDPLFSEQWGLKSINAIQAWELIPVDSKDIIIAVIDTGIDYLHPDLKNVLFKNDGELGIDNLGNDKSTNGIDDDKNGFVDDFQGWDFVDKLNIFPAELKADFTDWDNNPMDEHGHGTNIAGIIGADHNEIGIAGAYQNVKIMNLRAFDKNGTGEEDDAASAIIYAIKMGADIINMSWGDNQYSQLLKDVIEYAYENGVTLVGSSGNNSSNSPHYPSGFSSVISVGAIQENNFKASFSNYGSTLDLVAPGSQILTTNLDGSYKTVSGTSASAPFVSAASAMLKSRADFSNEEIKQILKSTANDLGEVGWDDLFGAGNLDMEKALKILSPSTIKFNNPSQNFNTSTDSLIINITCLSPYFKKYQLYFGIGDNPTNWDLLETGREDFQLLNEDVLIFNIADLADSSYTLRLVVNRTDGKTQEERVTFGVDRSPPNVLAFNFSNAILNDIESVQASLITDDISSAKLYFRNIIAADEFDYILLDGFNNNINNISYNHFGILPVNEVIGGVNHEFYFEITNQAGLTTIFKDGTNYFVSENAIYKNLRNTVSKNHVVPSGRIFSENVNFAGLGNNFVLLNETSTSADLNFYEFDTFNFVKRNSLQNRIPISVGDFNNDGKTDILSLFVKNGFIETQKSSGSLEFENVFSDTSGTFWPALAENIDDDSNTEIIVFSSDTTIAIWEVQSDFNLTLETELKIFSTDKNGNKKSIFRNNQIVMDDFDNDNKKEIVVADIFGNLMFYEVDNNYYKNDFIVETFFTIESNTSISKGDFNGDGTMDVGIITEFEDDQFITPLILTSVFTFKENKSQILFQTLLVTTGNNFISSFDKSYSAIRFEDLNHDAKDELIISSNPNAYVFEYDLDKPNLIFYQTNVNTQSIFTGDLDGNGSKEFSLPNTDGINFLEFFGYDNNSAPIIADYYSIDSEHVYFVWTNNDHPVYIFRSHNDDSMILYDSTDGNSYVDTVTTNTEYKYFLQYYDETSGKIISGYSNSLNIYAHAPGNFNDIFPLNTKSIRVSFSLPINSDRLILNNFNFNNEIYPSSLTLIDPKTILLNTNNPLSIGSHNLRIKNIRDIFNTPIADTSIQFEITENISGDDYLFISNYEIIDNYNLIIKYNFDLDSITALNTANYNFRPNNMVKLISYTNSDKKTIKLTTTKPFGSIGKEYILKVENIFSSLSSGYLPISQFSGSEIVLTSNAANLDDIYVYPNPFESGVHSNLTFANLPSKVDIYIFSIDGMFIKKISEEDGNGGLSWNLKNENNESVGSGIYFYKAISLDDLNNTIQEKIGKFAVVK